MQGSGRPTSSFVATIAILTVVMAAGTGFVPARTASAQVAELSTGHAWLGEIALAPASEAPKTEDLREPSGLGEMEASTGVALKPTVVAPPAPRRPAQAVATAAPSGWQSARVSWYGPGFYGNTMAGGGTLTPTSMVVAHRSLPFGTKVEFRYNGRSCVAVVQDRGPYIYDRVFDLGPGTASALGFSGVGTVQYRIIGR
jgi:rare lipoprotein A (peptidoglycan hydrolase)